MNDPLSLLGTRLAYAASQLPRLAWYAGHEIVLRRLAAEARRRPSTRARQPVQSSRPAPDQGRIYADMLALLRQDLANVEAGIYPLPRDHDGSLLTRLHRSQLFFADLPELHRRRERSGFREVLSEETRGRRPDYYLQNFHFQSGGWMTSDSADRYDTQVEVLFKGTANAMRRQVLPQLFEVFAGYDQRTLRLIDLGSGTGCFLDLVKQAWPRLPVLGLDLSEAYIRHARRHLRRWGGGGVRSRDPSAARQQKIRLTPDRPTRPSACASGERRRGTAIGHRAARPSRLPRPAPHCWRVSRSRIESLALRCRARGCHIRTPTLFDL